MLFFNNLYFHASLFPSMTVAMIEYIHLGSSDLLKLSSSSHYGPILPSKLNPPTRLLSYSRSSIPQQRFIMSFIQRISLILGRSVNQHSSSLANARLKMYSNEDHTKASGPIGHGRRVEGKDPCAICHEALKDDCIDCEVLPEGTLRKAEYTWLEGVCHHIFHRHCIQLYTDRPESARKCPFCQRKWEMVRPDSRDPCKFCKQPLDAECKDCKIGRNPKPQECTFVEGSCGHVFHQDCLDRKLTSEAEVYARCPRRRCLWQSKFLGGMPLHGPEDKAPTHDWISFIPVMDPTELEASQKAEIDAWGRRMSLSIHG